MLVADALLKSTQPDALASNMRLKAIDGIRGATALFIALYHVQIRHSLFDEYWFRDIQAILDIFFVISGFVIAMIYNQRLDRASDAVEFMIRRTGRIWPVQVLTLAILIGVELVRAIIMVNGGFDGAPAAFSGERTVNSILPNLVLTQSWGWDRPLDKAMTWNYPSWTVSTEYLAYALMAIVCIGMRERAHRALAAFAIMILAGLAYYEATDGWSDIRGISIARCVMGFFAGYLVNEARALAPVRASRLAATVVELSVLGGVLFLLGANGALYLATIGLIGALVFVFAADGGLCSALLSTPPLQWLGERSFSIYMIHVPVMAGLDFGARIVRKATGLATMWGEFISIAGAPWLNDVLAIGYLLTVLVCAAALYRYVEAPSRDFANKLAKVYRRSVEPMASPTDAPR